jgi:hypothetical protein
MCIVSRLRLVALSLTLAAPLAPVAFAETSSGSFDGLWVVDVPSSPVIAGEAESVCPALRLPLRVAENRLLGAMTRVPTITGGLVVEAGAGSLADSITGGVTPDGILHARWANYHADGQLRGDAGQIMVQTECGPALATAVRVSR